LYRKLSKLSIWFVSLLKKGAFLGMKLENRLKHGTITWCFVCGSEFRARWHDWIINSKRFGKSFHTWKKLGKKNFFYLFK
jgi:hypothetical protein